MTITGTTVVLSDEWRSRVPSRGLHKAADWCLIASAMATVGLAPLKGYLVLLDPRVAKLPAVILVALWFVVRFGFRTKAHLHAVHILLAALATVICASAVIHFAEPSSMMATIRWLPFLAVTAVLVDICGTEVPLRWLIAAAVFGATVAAAGALFSFLVLDAPRATGPVEDPNDLAYILIGTLPLLLAFNPKRRSWQLSLIAIASLITIGAAATLSRGAAIALVAALAYLVVRRAVPAKAALATAGAIVFTAGLAALAAGPHLLEAALGQKGYIAASNVDTRLLRWDAAARMLAENPVLGIGPGGFGPNYAVQSNLAEIQQPIASGLEYAPTVVHNMYLEVGAELGVLGLLAFLGIIVMALVSAELALRNGAERRLVFAVQGSLVAVIVASTFLSEQYYMSLWSLVAMGCSLSSRTGRKIHA